jgi:hypothetical protein
VGQHVPLAAGAVEVQERVEDLAGGDRPGPAARLGRGQDWLDLLPLGVGQVGGVGLPHLGSFLRSDDAAVNRVAAASWEDGSFLDSL